MDIIRKRECYEGLVISYFKAIHCVITADDKAWDSIEKTIRMFHVKKDALTYTDNANSVLRMIDSILSEVREDAIGEADMYIYELTKVVKYLLYIIYYTPNRNSEKREPQPERPTRQDWDLLNGISRVLCKKDRAHRDIYQEIISRLTYLIWVEFKTDENFFK
nr:MAG TPA: hypothetical protein [Caudoviricetes sp.]